jgi:hypothetical protein
METLHLDGPLPNRINSSSTRNGTKSGFEFCVTDCVVRSEYHQYFHVYSPIVTIPIESGRCESSEQKVARLTIERWYRRYFGIGSPAIDDSRRISDKKCRATDGFPSCLPHHYRHHRRHARVRVYQPRLPFHVPFHVKIVFLEEASNTPVCELITILGVNGFAWDEMTIKVRLLVAHILLLRALDVNLDPRLSGVPEHAMTETSGIKIDPSSLLAQLH